VEQDATDLFGEWVIGQKTMGFLRQKFIMAWGRACFFRPWHAFCNYGEPATATGSDVADLVDFAVI